MRHVIAAIQIVIDKDFPVTVERVAATFEPVKIGELQVQKLIAEILFDNGIELIA